MSTSIMEEVIVIDTDAGIDDAWAILMMLSSEKRNLSRKIIGITCVHGNTTSKQVCLNVIRTLESSNRLDIPVFNGASHALINDDSEQYENFFGSDGFGCAEHIYKPNERLIKGEHAVVALNRIACDNKGKVSILCLGPLTNVALAIRTYPKFEQNVNKIVIMGGNYTAEGNATNCAEYNFHRDPEAAHIVLNSAIGLKILVPWETCDPLIFPLVWRDNVLGACSNRGVELLNRAEAPLRAKPTFVSWMPCDQVAAAVLLNPEVVTDSSQVHLTVELHGQHTRGQVVVAHKTKRKPNSTLVKAVDKHLLEEALLSVHAL